MHALLSALSIALAVAGIVGCVVPVVPGPVLAFGGLLVLLFGDAAPGMATLVWFGAGCAASLLMDTFLPPLVSKRFGGGKAGMWGSLAGSVVGMWFFPVGVIVGAFVGALAFEKVFAKKGWRASARAGTGAFLGFLLGMAVKLAYCAACLVAVLRA